MTVPLQIVILEDNVDRRLVMLECLSDRFSQYDVRFFVTAGEMIAHLRANLHLALAIALDHDLDLIPIDPRRNIDPGSGRDVADFLATLRPVCPVLIHSTNAPAAFGMQRELQDAGWKSDRVIPSDGERWIRNEWLVRLRNLIVDAVGKTPLNLHDQTDGVSPSAHGVGPVVRGAGPLARGTDLPGRGGGGPIMPRGDEIGRAHV